MSCFIRPLVLSAAFAAVPFALAQTPVPGALTSPDPSKPPPFVDLPSTTETKEHSDKKTEAIPRGLRERVDKQHAAWAKGTAKGLNAGLVYFDGRPIVTLVTSPQEPEWKKSQRKKAAVMACEFLMEDDAFAEAVMCIVTFDAKDPSATKTQNTLVKRGAFHNASKKAGKSENLSSALSRVKNNGNAITQICDELGIQ